MAFPKKKYVTTDRAGWHVAGRKIPQDIRDGKLIPKVGHPLELTELEARHEIAAGTIEPVEQASKRSSKGE